MQEFNFYKKSAYIVLNIRYYLKHENPVLYEYNYDHNSYFKYPTKVACKVS